jgi:hypothetical protein
MATGRIVRTPGAAWMLTSSDADEIEQWHIAILDFKAELDRFNHAFTKLIKRSSLCVATRQSRNGGDVVALRILLHNHIKLAAHGVSPVD